MDGYGLSPKYPNMWQGNILYFHTLGLIPYWHHASAFDTINVLPSRHHSNQPCGVVLCGKKGVKWSKFSRSFKSNLREPWPKSSQLCQLWSQISNMILHNLRTTLPTLIDVDEENDVVSKARQPAMAPQTWLGCQGCIFVTHFSIGTSK